ncbi:hybrid sensor histidine kinase/response regulator [Tabrizicola sp.]|uniref:ATP-binding response regulator n=1 Tax=Tabrizicola sp. TaxID=2005166 RepID=UPI0035B43F8D
MLRDGDDLERRIEKLGRINAALIERLDHYDKTRGSAWSLFQAALALEKEVAARNRDLERALADLSQKNHELAAARMAAEEANRSKTRFLRAASHDLLQPLSAARLFLSTLATMELGGAEADLVKRLGNAFESVEELIRAVLDISRLDSQRIEFNRKPVNLNALFDRLRGEFEAPAAARRLRLRFVRSSLAVDSDPVFLRRIAQNLVSNAIKYTETGSVLVGARRRGARAWLEVHDTGIGIPAEDRDQIFAEFHRLEHDRRGEPGMGLGLSIVKRACAKLDHPIALDSEPGRGSVFRIGLEIVARNAPPRRSSARPPADRDRLRGKHALIVEDNAAMRHGYAVILRDSWGMRTQVVEGTAAARDAATRPDQPPDLILADYHLRGSDTGLRTITLLRKLSGTEIPAIVVTAHRTASVVRSCARHGVRVLEKPIRPEDLRDALLRLVGEQT